MNKIWFKAKRYGYGSYPATWEGWAVMALWLVAFVRLTFVFAAQAKETNDPGSLYWYLPLVVLITGALILICWAKGEPMRWRWGEKDK